MSRHLSTRVSTWFFFFGYTHIRARCEAITLISPMLFRYENRVLVAFEKIPPDKFIPSTPLPLFNTVTSHVNSRLLVGLWDC